MELDHKKKYSEIIELGNGEQLVSFFKKLNAEDRRALIPSIKQDIKRLYTTRELSRRIWGYAGTREQLNMLSIAMFVCYGKADRKLIKPHLLPADKQIDNIYRGINRNGLINILMSYLIRNIYLFNMKAWLIG